MSYFLYPGLISQGESFTLDDDEARHALKSKRLKAGRHVLVQDQGLTRWQALIIQVSPKGCQLQAVQEVQTPSEPQLAITLCLALVKEKALDFTLQKATELGASRVILFESDHSQSLKTYGKLDKRLQRWERIIWEACKQSGRLKPPLIEIDKGLGPLLINSKDQTTLVLAQTGAPLDCSLLPQAPVNLIIGPEGGWSPEEQILLQPFATSLGPRILKAETAAIAALSLIQHGLGDMGKPA